MRDEKEGMRYEVEGMRKTVAIPSHPSSLIHHTSSLAPTQLVCRDGVIRQSTAADAPLAGRSAERNAVRREEKLADVEAANAQAQSLGGWGLTGNETGFRLPNINRRYKTEWVSKCIRRWCSRNKVALLEGTTKLIGNGGYKFLQEIWDTGNQMLPDDAIEALDVFLKAKTQG